MPSAKDQTTISDPETRAIDLLKRCFGPDTVELDGAYVSDITYLWTEEGWLYLATVIDLASRRVVGVGGRWPTTCAPSWCPTPSGWPSPPVTPLRG